MLRRWRAYISKARFPSFRECAQARRPRLRLVLEDLENRTVPTTNYSVSAIPFTATPLSTSDPGVFTVIPYGDQVADPIPLGTNHINFYGGDYTDTPTHSYLWVSGKGILTIYNPDTGFGNSDLTTAPNVPTIAALWSDWNAPPSSTPMVDAKYDVPNNLLIVQWNNLFHFAGNNNTVTFQVVLQLNTGSTPGTITVNYFNIDTGDKNANGATSTIGVKDWGPQGPSRLLVSFNALNPLIGSYKSIQFTWGQPVPPPLITSLNPTTVPETSPAQLLTVNGSSFDSDAVIQLNGTALPTTFINSTQLQATLPASALAEDGKLPVTVYNPGSPGKTSDPFIFPVFDALLTAQGETIAATEGQPLTNVLVATFTDPGSDGTTADYTATITWTDNNNQIHNDPGIIQIVDPHTFNVVAANLGPYGNVGPQLVGIAIADKGGSNAAAQTVINVSDAPLMAEGKNLATSEGQTLSNVVVATFSDPAGDGTTGKYAATITWTDSGGQAHTIAGTIQATGLQTFNVLAGNLGPFGEEGAYPIGILITDQGGSSVSIQSTVNAADAPLAALGQTTTGTEGQSLANAVVASFTDPGSDGTAADYVATITWTDSSGQTHTSSGIIQATGSQTFNVLAGTVGPYAEEGTYSLSILITDKGGSSASAQSTVNVGDAPLAVQGQTPAATEGQSLANVVVASFTDPGSDGTTADYATTITWTDSSGQTHTSPGTIQATGPQAFNVLVANLGPYAEEGTYPIGILITDKGGSSASAQSTVNVSDAPLAAQGQTLASTEGQSLANVLVASFTDPGSDGTIADYAATITWTDSSGQTHTTAGTIQATGAQTLNVVASNLGPYAEEGAFPISIVIADKGGSSATAQSTVNVGDAPLTAQGQTLAGIEGQSLTNVVVASFTDPGSDGTTADYAATITWTDSSGQTHTTAGTIQATGPQAFNVVVANLGPYAEEGTYTIGVRIADQGGSVAAVQSTVIVGDASLVSSSQNVNAITGLAFTGQVATFTDANPYAPAGDFTASIQWGDGQTSQGTIVSNANGGFAVTGTNTFASRGSYSVAVHIVDKGGAATTARGTAIVTDSIPALIVSLTQNPLNPAQVQVNGTYSDLVAKHHTAVINWGDGTIRRIDLGTSARGSFALTHSYTSRFTHQNNLALINVTVVDDDGTSSAVDVLFVAFNHKHH
jgi:hypothetical protein